MPPPPVPPSAQPSAPETTSGRAIAPTTPAPELTTLRTHIQTLTELNNRLQAIRNIPAQLLRPPGSDPSSTLLTHGFKEIAAIADTVRTEKVQDALKAARKSEQADSSGLTSSLRRETLKRRRPPSPDSPQPYRETELKEAVFLPLVESGTSRILLDALPAYIRNHNKSSKNKLHLVAPRKGRELACPLTLRFTCPNVVTVYLTLDYSTDNDQILVVENATAIGSREQKQPHSQSDFMAFQQLSQQLAKVIRSDPSAPLQAYVALLSSYERLFVDICSNCQRVISAEGHVPPVVRKRLLSSSADPKAPQWDVRHVLCKYEPPAPQANPGDHGVENEGEGGGKNGEAGSNA
ncbi:hypothetical protein DICSQDRAFT_157163 [Dichomitus squalens LYAD-421 SS1]|uniref:Uncharacterized protein n=1 Tax=Dichomitus squalens (strain LYAD-421) TaxID=732165 RepID=R7SNH9_DICSQ|nr:uncharacterized protein DICSQDRAFT_157163 [Dichomitus squalens LYAD-421 SS1]EJF57734.1 hypothetical protein DICSQDRAFT_157163 [Dichomitus squalens LYAD-421 SS1]